MNEQLDTKPTLCSNKSTTLEENELNKRTVFAEGEEYKPDEKDFGLILLSPRDLREGENIPDVTFGWFLIVRISPELIGLFSPLINLILKASESIVRATGLSTSLLFNDMSFKPTREFQRAVLSLDHVSSLANFKNVG